MTTLSQRLRIFPKHFRYGAMNRMIHAAAAIGHRNPGWSPQRYGVFLERNVVYGPTRHRDHRLDVYVPTNGSGPHPVVMYVHGGAFTMLSKETHRVMALSIARRGYLVFNINYRQGFKSPFPAPLEDAARALLWVHKNAHRYGADVNRLAIAGESAGGNLVATLGLMHGIKRPEPFAREVYDANLPLKAVVSTYPVLDLSNVERFTKHPRIPLWARIMLGDAAASYLGSVPAHAEERQLASPLRIIESGVEPTHRLPPFFLSCGTKDPLLDDSRRLAKALKSINVPCELLIAPGEIHGYDAMLWRPAAREKWERVHAFLAQHLAGT